MKLNIATLLLALLGLFALLAYAMAQAWTPLRIAGVAIAVPSMLLLVLARIQLGRAFSIRAKASELVTTGLYSRIRNPIYFFGALGFAGIVLWTGKMWLFLPLAALVAMQILRSRREEQVLSERFGAVYAEYRRKTWF